MINRINVVTTDRANYPDLNAENEHMIQALRRSGFEPLLISWHDLYEQLQNNEYDNVPVLVRTVWDYPEYINKFLSFVRMLKDHRVLTVNPPDIIEWNIRKTYLIELQEAGIPVVPCYFAPAGSTIEAKERRIVAKPIIGLGAVGAYLLEPGTSLIVQVDSLVNPFLSSIHNGEISIVMISGKPTLFIKKIPSSSDWRVQPQYGGRYTIIDTVSADAIEVSKKLYDYVHGRFGTNSFLYMRVDLLINDEGKFEVLEFEAIDPSMYGSISSSAINTLSSSLSMLIADKLFY